MQPWSFKISNQALHNQSIGSLRVQEVSHARYQYPLRGGKKKEGVLKNNVNPCISGLESRNEEEVGK